MGIGLPILTRSSSVPVSGASVIERSPEAWSARSTPSVTAGMRIDDTAVRKPSRSRVAQDALDVGMVADRGGDEAELVGDRRARSSEPRMYSVGCQRNWPMPKVAQQ